jgi:hypothetical protein
MTPGLFASTSTFCKKFIFRSQLPKNFPEVQINAIQNCVNCSYMTYIILLETIVDGECITSEY